MRTPRPGPAARGYDKEWHRARGHHLKHNPLCAMCLAQGKRTKALHVDHAHTIRARPDLRLDPRNFISLCAGHHAQVTRAYDSGDLRGACDVDGQPLDPGHPWLATDTASAIAAANVPHQPRHAPGDLAMRLKRRAIYGR